LPQREIIATKRPAQAFPKGRTNQKNDVTQVVHFHVKEKCRVNHQSRCGGRIITVSKLSDNFGHPLPHPRMNDSLKTVSIVPVGKDPLTQFSPVHG
jgi:hypothetical protein